MANLCLCCEKKLIGRSDKKFCDENCRNSYNNQKNRIANNLMRNTNNRLRKNRKILAEILKDEETKKVNLNSLKNKDFDFDFLTEIYTTQKGTQYYFVYEYGYLNLKDDWFLLVKRRENDINSIKIKK